MRKKKDASREIPIKFVDRRDEEAKPDDDAYEIDADDPELVMDPEPAEAAEEAEGASSQTDETGAAEPNPQAELQAQVDTLAQEKVALYDQLLRRQAEFENYRKRVERERTDAHHKSRADLLVELLPVLDNFERALASLQTSGADAAGLRHGVELIHRQFKDALTKFGLQPVEALGQTFDPHLHEAVTIEATDEHKENTVIEEFERGYKLGDKLLRPAKVKVASSPDR
ncbi:MAG TPA: nucleotide exchange factor GrpE [Blastocatellia bacterium]|nr:nucleotide exchange factor GrpE [Blastocatellia bacterium]